MKLELQKFKYLTSLKLINLKLRSVNNFPELPYLEILNLSKNCIKDEALPIIMKLYPTLLELNLRDNRIRCQKNIEQLQNSNIEQLDLRNNFVSSRQFTHEFIFDKMKSLMIFNGKYKDNRKVKQIQFDQEVDDCLSSQSSVSFNNPDSEEEQDQTQKNATSNYWYQPKAERNLRYLKNVTKEQKLRIKKRKSPYAWDRTLSYLKKEQKREKLQENQ